MDAICIDQADIAERQQQVAIMRDVYKKAACVLAWLGEPVEWTELALTAIESTRLAFEAIHLIVAHALKLAETQPLRNVLETRSVQRYPCPECHFGAVNRLYWNPWFSRVWIVQEIVLGTSPVVYCGSESRSWWEIGLAATWLSRLMSLRGEEKGYGGPSDRNLDTTSTIWESTALNAPRRLDSLLVMSMERESTVPHDKVYGILGLLEDYRSSSRMQGEIVVDYQADLATVYASATRAAIMSAPPEPALDILQYAQNARMKDSAQEWPSWTPQYHARDEWERPPIKAFGYAANETHFEAKSGTTDVPNLLILSGVHHSRVDRCLADPEWSVPRDWIKWMEECQTLALSLGYSLESIASTMTCGSTSTKTDARHGPDHTSNYEAWMLSSKH